MKTKTKKKTKSIKSKVKVQSVLMSDLPDERFTKKKENLIDILHTALKKAGYDVERDGWEENMHSEPPNDYCEWLDVRLKSTTNPKEIFTVHFYFSNDSTQLDDISIFKSKLVYEDDKIVAK